MAFSLFRLGLGSSNGRPPDALVAFQQVAVLLPGKWASHAGSAYGTGSQKVD
jgi:hypothetical protein